MRLPDLRLPDLRLPGLGGWSDDPLWGTFYDWTVEHPRLGGALWRLGTGADLGLLYDAAAEIGRQPAGAAVLDVPSGGGVALRGLRPGQGVRYVAADISALMLRRTREAALARGVSDQVETVVADVGDLGFDDGAFDLVVNLTGLHCFPDPHAALRELGRVTRPGGVVTGSTLLRGSDPRAVPLHVGGRLAGLLGPGLTETQLRAWLSEAGYADVTVRLSGSMGFFRAVRFHG